MTMTDDTEAMVVDRPLAPIEYRMAETLDVRFPDRIVEVLAIPYEVETAAVVEGGRQITEVFARGAFDGVERRANRVKVNRDHQREKTVGRAVKLTPAHERGLVADLRISHTPLGDETLELAADGVLDASIAFAPMPGGQEWDERRSRRRVRRAWLGHIALIPDPAYEDAQVLDVRSAAAAVDAAVDEAIRRAAAPPVVVVSSLTPNKDEMLARLAEIGYHPRNLKS